MDFVDRTAQLGKFINWWKDKPKRMINNLEFSHRRQALTPGSLFYIHYLPTAVCLTEL